MAKVLTEQPRLMATSGADPRQVGDGAPVHSAIPFDLARTLNNMQSYREPSYQFLHDVSLPVVGDSPRVTRIRYHMKAIGTGDGTCMLGQAPIYVPIDATRLRWSLGIYRFPVPAESSIEVNVNDISMYLCSEPARVLRDPVPATITADNENCRQFDESSLTGAWTKNTVAAGATAGGSGDPVYTLIRSSTWTDFAPRGVNNILDRKGDPWAYLIATADFSGGVTGETITGAELCLWFEYDDAPFLLDDATRVAARNGKAALAQVLRSIVTTANKFSCRPKPIFNWWGGNPLNVSEDNAESSIRRMWITGSEGARRLKGKVLALPIADVAGAPQTGLLLNTEENGDQFPVTVPQSPGRREDLNTPSTDWYPQYVQPVEIFGEHAAEYPATENCRQVRVHVGDSSGPTYGPQLRSGLILERRGTDPVIGTDALSTDPYSIGAEILGEGPTAKDLRALRDFINRLARQRMIHFGYGIMKNSATAPYGHNVTNGVGTNRRYLLNRDVGEGGIAPTVDGPGIEIPTRYTGLGRDATIRAYIRIYAKMSGTTNTAQLSYYNRNNSGGMTSVFAVTNTPTISGTTYQWYPNTTTINEATDPHITLNANPAYDADHLVLCGGRNGSTDDLMVVAWTICIRASEA